MREIPADCRRSAYRNAANPFQLRQDDTWCALDLAGAGILELHFPGHTLRLGDDTTIAIDRQSQTQLLALCVDHVDILLEDWYPTLGTRFVHTSEGRFLVTRLVPCPRCLQRLRGADGETDGVTAEANGTATNGSGPQQQPLSRRKVSATNYTWMMEECILAAYEQSFVACPNHGNFTITDVAPDIVSGRVGLKRFNSSALTAGVLLCRCSST